MSRRDRRVGVVRVAAAFQVALLSAALAGCSSGGGGGGGGNPAGAVPKATAVGAPTGAVVSKVIGAAGDSLTSADAKVTLTVPASALAADTDIGIQPIQNLAHGGVGPAYRLTPDGQVFTAPVTLAFTYTDADVANSAPQALGIAFQHTDGFWEWLTASAVDTVAKTVTVTTDHFTDYSQVEGFQILPSSATISTLEAIPLKVVYCFDPVSDPDLASLVGYACDEQSFIDDPDLAPLIPIATVSDWRANGIAGGNASVGVVAGGNESAVYTAPGMVPASNPVAVSAKATWRSGTATVVSNITVVDSDSLKGPISFETQFGAQVGSGEVTWTLFENLADVRRYLPSGTLDVTIQLADDCDPLETTFTIETGTPELPVGTLVVYDEVSGFPSKYQFAIATQPKNLTFQCGDPKEPVTIEDYTVDLFVGLCTSTADFPDYDDPAHLTDTWACGLSGTSAEWDFSAAP